MSELLKGILDAAPQLAVAVLLLVIVIVVHRHASQDRESYRRELAVVTDRYSDEIRKLQEAHDAELRRVHSNHNLEIAELKADIVELRSSLDSLGRQLDDERRLRRQAEDVAAQALRATGAQ